MTHGLAAPKHYVCPVCRVSRTAFSRPMCDGCGGAMKLVQAKR